MSATAFRRLPCHRECNGRQVGVGAEWRGHRALALSRRLAILAASKSWCNASRGWISLEQRLCRDQVRGPEALREVSDALTRLAKLSAAETAQDMSVKALGEAVEHAMDRYRQGLANYFEVLEAQQQLYPAQNTLAQIRQNRLRPYAQLYRALGGGWALTDAQWSGQGEAPTK